MTIIVPKRTAYHTRPSSYRDLANNSIARDIDYVDMYYPGFLVQGNITTGAGEIVSYGNNPDYLQFTSEGLENTVNVSYADGLVLENEIREKFNVREGINYFFGFKDLPGNLLLDRGFNILSDIYSNSSGTNGYNGIGILGTTLGVELSAKVVNFSNAILRDGSFHNYSVHIELVYVSSFARNIVATVYRDGVAIATDSSQTTNGFNTRNKVVSTSSAYQYSNGINGVLSHGGMINKPYAKDAIKSLSENPYQILKPRRKFFVFGGAGGGITLGAAAQSNTTSTANLTTQIPLSSAVLSVATASGAITLPINLQGAAAVVTLADGVLSTQIPISGTVIAEALAAAGLDTNIDLIASVDGRANAGGDLTTLGGGLEGAAAAIASSSASITAQITLDAAALAEVLAAADLTAPGTGFAGDAIAQANAGGVLVTDIQMAAAPTATATVNGSITTGIPIEASAAVVANVLGGLSTSITFDAAALAQTLVQGDLTAAQGLSGAVLVNALADADLDTGIFMSAASLVEATAVGSLTDLSGFFAGGRVFKEPLRGSTFRQVH